MVVRPLASSTDRRGEADRGQIDDLLAEVKRRAELVIARWSRR